MGKKSKGKQLERRRRRGMTVTAGALQTMQALAAAVSLTSLGVEALKRLPHAYDTLEEGLGKKPLTNKRVLIIAGLLLYCILSKNVKTRLWSVPLMALLTLAVVQHRATYQADDSATAEIFEKYDE